MKVYGWNIDINNNCARPYNNEVNVGDVVTVTRLGGFLGNHSFGEYGKVTKFTAQHLVITTDSGAIVKTRVDNLFDVVGKAGKDGYSVVLGKKPEDEFVKQNVRYWNSKKQCFETK